MASTGLAWLAGLGQGAMGFPQGMEAAEKMAMQEQDRKLRERQVAASEATSAATLKPLDLTPLSALGIVPAGAPTSLDPRLGSAAMTGLSAQATEARRLAREREDLGTFQSGLEREAFAMPESGVRAENEPMTERDPALAQLARMIPGLGLAKGREMYAKRMEPEETVFGAAGAQPFGKRTGLPRGSQIPPKPEYRQDTVTVGDTQFRVTYDSQGNEVNRQRIGPMAERREPNPSGILSVGDAGALGVPFGTTRTEAIGRTPLLAGQRTKVDAMSAVEGMIGQIERDLKDIASPSGSLGRIWATPKRLWSVYAQGDAKITALHSRITGSLAQIVRALGDVGTLNDQDIVRAKNLQPVLAPIPDTQEVIAEKIKGLRQLTREIASRVGTRPNTMAPTPLPRGFTEEPRR